MTLGWPHAPTGTRLEQADVLWKRQVWLAAATGLVGATVLLALWLSSYILLRPAGQTSVRRASDGSIEIIEAGTTLPTWMRMPLGIGIVVVSVIMLCGLLSVLVAHLVLAARLTFRTKGSD